MLELIQVDSVHIIPATDDNQVRGITTLNSQLYILRERSQHIDIYNTTDFAKTGHVDTSDMKNPRSLVSCSHNNCLYISDSGDIHRVQLPDQLVTKWKVGSVTTVSITRAYNLLATSLYYNMLFTIVYT